MGERVSRAARIGAGGLVAGALAAALLFLPTGRWMLELVEWIRGTGSAGVLVYALAYVAATLLFLPGSVLTAGAGFAYGPLWGLLLVSPVSVLAATLAFGAGRSFGRSPVSRRMERHPRFAAVDRAIGENGFRIVFLLRLSPVFPFNLLNYALGVTPVRTRDYVLASWLGMLPGTFLYVYLGSLVTNATEIASGVRPAAGAWSQVLYWAGLAATVVATVVVTRIARRALKRTLDDATPVRSGHPTGSEPVTGVHLPGLHPDDPQDRALLQNVHPPEWENPTPSGRYNLVVLGAGTAGLVSAVGAAGLGARVAIVERRLMGGDCLNYGCVPSKAVLHAARVAEAARRAGAGAPRPGAGADGGFTAAMDRMRRLRARISSNDSAHRLAALGIDVFMGEARFVASDAVEVDGQRLEFSRAVIATGTGPAAPPVPGLAEAGFLTNETVFSLTELPRRLVVVGAGPVGCELAQAFRRFGSEVAVVNRSARLLPRDDADAAALLAERFEREGIRMVLGAEVRRVEREGGGKRVVVTGSSGPDIVGDEILVAVGRDAALDGLGLEAAGIAYGREGVEVDDRLRTTNRRVYAAGDVCSRYKFTHAADAMARVALRNALFLGRRKASALVIPWCTYTDPEVAHVGLREEEARERGLDFTTLTRPFAQVDRAILDGEEEGFARVHVERRSGRILGATMVAAHAGEMISEISLAMTQGLPLGTMGDTVHPYPTQAEAWKHLGDEWNRARLTPFVRGLLERYLSWRR